MTELGHLHKNMWLSLHWLSILGRTRVSESYLSLLKAIGAGCTGEGIVIMIRSTISMSFAIFNCPGTDYNGMYIWGSSVPLISVGFLPALKSNQYNKKWRMKFGAWRKVDFSNCIKGHAKRGQKKKTASLGRQFPYVSLNNTEMQVLPETPKTCRLQAGSSTHPSKKKAM